MSGLTPDEQLEGLIDEEDLFDFASLESATAALEADELGVEEFLAAVERLDDPEPALPSDMADDETPSLSEVMNSAERAASVSHDPEPRQRSAAAAGTKRDAPAEAAEPTVVLAPVKARFSPLVAAAALVLLALNGAISFLAWNSSQVAATQLETAREQLDRAAVELVGGIDNEVDRIDRGRSPITAPPALATDGLAHVEVSMERGDYELSRRQLYAVLSLIDRVDESRRAGLEARANFMLGDVDRLEAAALRGGVMR